jgi:hypothetical protein
MNNDSRKPSDFMRARRPELYSDTVISDEPVLTKTQFEFHLDTLTQRKDEIRFEHFCRKLAEKELCPNLLPQTGPTGGGDSKTDSETYPVADSIAERWFVGDPRRSSQERWAFAFSAIKTWQPKVVSDVEKIIKADRGYSLIYFISNQAISDRNRAKNEDDLTKKWGVPVRILDRSWIIEKVINNNRWDVVLQTLDVDSPHVERKHSVGPYDAERLRELEEIDRQIEDAGRYSGPDYQLAEDCLHTALLARGLGRPRTEIDGRFDRADRIARKHNDQRQLFRVIYNRAWTAFWWFGDIAELDRLYKLAEPLVLDGEWVWDLEYLVNLWQVRYASMLLYQADENMDEWSGYTSKLRASLMRHASDANKPTSALWARTELVLMDLGEAAKQRDLLPSVISNINAILSEADGHLDFPAHVLIRIVQEMGQFLGNDKAFDALFETVATFERKRSGEAVEGKLRLERGYQKLKADKTYEAIEQFARAQNLLVQDELKGEFVQAVVGTALGYEAAGLLWAARANMVLALDRVMYEYSKNGKIAPQVLPLLRKMVWIELQLGRIPCVICWVEWLNLVAPAFTLDESRQQSLRDEFGMMDAVLGILVLKTRRGDWASLDRVAALFERHGLIMSRGAALFSLGYEDAFRTEYGEPSDDLDELFSKWLEQPAAADLPINAEWHLGRTVAMRTVILGCEIELLSENKTPSILLAEAALAFLESFFSTVIGLRGHWSLRPYLKIELTQSEYAKVPFTHRIAEDDCGETSIVIAHNLLPQDMTVKDVNCQQAFHNLLLDFIKLLQIHFSQETLGEIMGNQRALDRAFLVAQSPITVTNVLSFAPKYRVADWVDEKLTESLALIRTSPWVAKIVDEDVSEATPSEFADVPPPEGMFGVDALKHRELRIFSPINMPLWDVARWRGIGVAIPHGTQPVPELTLLFENYEAGEKIFRGWKKHVGEIDREEWIGITIITGTDKDFPAHYRTAISVGNDFLLNQRNHARQFMYVFRMQDMTPSDNANLSCFIKYFADSGCYRLSLAQMSNSRFMPYDGNQYSIMKKKIRIVPAWEIGPNDPASAAIGGIENPIIPDGVIDPPFTKAKAMRDSKLNG